MCMSSPKPQPIRKTPPPLPDPIETADTLTSPETIRKNRQSAASGGRSGLTIKRSSVNAGSSNAGVNAG